jgi:hypothetical protein
MMDERLLLALLGAALGFTDALQSAERSVGLIFLFMLG